MTEKKTRSPKRMLFMALTWLSIPLLIEIGVRVVYPQMGEPVYPGYPPGLVIPDNDLGHAYQTGFAGHYPAPEYADIPIEINSYGYRDGEWARLPNADRPRVMVLGDSVTFGSPLAREERFTEQAAIRLQKKGRAVEFCNCGVNGYNVEQYARLLRQRGPDLKPELVLIGLVLNDAEPLSPDDAKRIALGDAIKRGSAWAKVRRLSHTYNFDLGQSYAFNLVRRSMKMRAWQSAQGDELIKQYIDKTRQELGELYAGGDGPARLREQFAAMKQFADDELQAKIGVVIFCYHHQVQNQDPALSRQIEALLTELGIPFADLYDVFLPHADEDLYARNDDCHPNARGHQLAGNAAAKLVVRMIK
ncbi:MAG: SGNH/GDSL hydrolase family protein [Alphaproteobacteria bacterium]